MADDSRSDVPCRSGTSPSAMTPAPPATRHPVAPLTQYLVALASVVIIVAGMRASAEILAPILFGFVLATAVAPLIDWLSRLGMPRLLAWLTVIVGVVVVGLVLIGVLLDSAAAFAQRLPVYQTLMAGRAAELSRWLASRGLAGPELGALLQTNAQEVRQTGDRLLGELISVLYSGLLVLVVALLFLVASPFRTSRQLPHPPGTASGLLAFSRAVQQTMLGLTQTNLVTAVVITLWLRFFRVDFAVMWGLLAFFLGYVPNVGVLVAAVPPTLLALILYGGSTALIVAVGLAAIVVIVNIVTNALTASSIALSPVTAFIAFVFWAWVLGPLGTLLAFPLTVAVKLILEVYPNTRWLAALMGRRSPSRPSDSAH